ncbi:hypothetical protein C8R43DRAFT_955335 [Mycena crocata]|nr:hypothetical protein C8R43DRAFT_963717 [Mycena crocata]KAJ7106139.1 hypothetical protein C8R43DRAFT_963466 [Mycena crocata]KAJ7138478.1 hypothetical protein C8R43DRAFT_955335 [Mycena crocata]
MSDEPIASKTSDVHDKAVLDDDDVLPDLISASASEAEDSDNDFPPPLETDGDDLPPPLVPSYDNEDFLRSKFSRRSLSSRLAEEKQQFYEDYRRVTRHYKHLPELRRAEDMHISYDVVCTYGRRQVSCCHACDKPRNESAFGMTDGERVEQDWASINPTARTTKEIARAPNFETAVMQR